MVKKKASLAGRGAEILFGTKAPPTITDSSANDTASDIAFESNQQGDSDAAAGASALSASAPASLEPTMSTIAPLEVGPDHPAPVPSVLPPGTVIDITKPAALPTSVTALPARTYDIPPPPDADQDATGTPRPAVLPPLAVITPPTSATTTTVQPATTSGGPVSNPTSTPPSRGTSIVSPTTAGPQSMTPAAPGNGASTPSAPPPATTPSGNGAPSSAAGGITLPSAPAPIPMPPPVSMPSASPQPQNQGVPVSDILRIAAQISADRDAAVEAAQKAKEQFQVDETTVKDLRQHLFKEIEELYHTAGDTVQDSPTILNNCLDMLKEARLNLLSSSGAGDLSQAEFLIEKVRTKLKRSDDPVPSSEFAHVVWICLWQLLTFLIYLPMAVVPWAIGSGSLSVFGIPISKDLIPLMAAAGWGGIGGVIGTLYNLPWFVQRREYDPAFNLDYTARPVTGFLVGGVVFLLFTTGLGSVSATPPPNTPGQAATSYALIYLLAALGGFKQELVLELFVNVLKVFFRSSTESVKSGQSGTGK